MKNMIHVLLMAVVAVLACGFSVTSAPEQLKAQEREAREWAKTIQSRYDFAELGSFLKKVVSEKKNWQGIDLAKPKIGNKWTIGSGSTFMISGDWCFRTPNPKEDKFTLSFSSYRDKKNGLDLIFNCIRKAKDKFELIDITSDEFEVVELAL